MENDTEPNLLPQWFTEILSPFSTVLAEQNLWSWFWDMNPPFPQVIVFLIKTSFPFLPIFASKHWLLRGEQLNPSSVTTVGTALFIFPSSDTFLSILLIQKLSSHFSLWVDLPLATEDTAHANVYLTLKPPDFFFLAYSFISKRSNLFLYFLIF